MKIHIQSCQNGRVTIHAGLKLPKILSVAPIMVLLLLCLSNCDSATLDKGGSDGQPILHDAAVVLTAAPQTIPSTLSEVSFEELRAGDNDGTLGWLWDRVNAGTY